VIYSEHAQYQKYSAWTRDLRFVFFVRIESSRPSDSFSNRIFESNRPYTTQAVTQPNGLEAYCSACYRPIICWRLALWTCVLYLIQTRDTNTLRAQYLENYLSYETSNLVCSFLSGMPSARTNNFLWKWAWPRSRDPQFLVYDRAYLQNYLS